MGGVRHQGDPERETLVFDATPIIYLCKVGLAGKLGELSPSFRLLTTTEVYEEVCVKEVEKSAIEGAALKELFDDGMIEVVGRGKRPGPMKSLARESGIHTGEESVLSLALRTHATAIVDDRRARQVARALGIRLSGTPGVIIELVRRHVIPKGEARDALEKMVDEGWYCSAKLFSVLLRTTEEAE
ncbi:MAG: DUF3368 domain-containing protein [Nitrososphaerota archaeon]|nr:DUF3368 domain-containing protein [Nitrososphaerota archaeon]